MIFLLVFVYWSLFNNVIIFDCIKLWSLSSFFIYDSLLVLLCVFIDNSLIVGSVSLIGVDKSDDFFVFQLIKPKFFFFFLEYQFFSFKLSLKLFSLPLKSSNFLISFFFYLRPLRFELLDLFFELINRVFVDFLLLCRSFFLFLF